eukprot:JP439720.1.p3 GENE.JP439720.1~~JP439720.1.p3  ORF type:complete len:67 (+),score=3.10 JP439720.1:149-349(+)
MKSKLWKPKPNKDFGQNDRIDLISIRGQLCFDQILLNKNKKTTTNPGMIHCCALDKIRETEFTMRN